jgi:hypothetical protein
MIVGRNRGEFMPPKKKKADPDPTTIELHTRKGRVGLVAHWHQDTAIVFPDEVSVGGGGFVGHAQWGARCGDTDHPSSLPGVQPDGRWLAEFHDRPEQAFEDAAEHSDGHAIVMRRFGGAVVGPVDPNSP